MESQLFKFQFWISNFFRNDDGWQEGPKVKPAKNNTGAVDQLTTGFQTLTIQTQTLLLKKIVINFDWYSWQLAEKWYVDEKVKK